MKTIKEIVLNDFNEAKENGYTSYLQDVVQNGCVSGMVNHLIYYGDTCEFFEQHKREISNLLSDLLCEVSECGVLFGDKWDKEDPLALETNNQNLLAWFGYEETARQILDELENN